MWKRKVVSFDEFAHVCPYFTSACAVNNGYGCTHPKQEETDFDRELGREHGKCYDYSCPLGITPDAEDLDNPDVDWDGITKDDVSEEDGNFLEGDYLMVSTEPDASEDEKKALEAYERYMNRYNY